MVNNDPGGQKYQYDWQNPNNRSFDVGRVVSTTFGTLRDNPVPFFLLTFIGAGIPMMLFSLWPIFLGVGGGINIYDPTWFEDIEWSGIIGPAIAIYFLYLVLILVMYSAIIKMTVNAINKRAVDLGEAVRTGLSLFFPILGITILASIGIMFGFLLLIIPGIFLALGWMLAFHVKIIEGTSVTESLSRSWELSKGYKRWILLVMVIFAVFGMLISLAFQIPVLVLGNPQTAIVDGGTTTFWVANAIATGLTQMISVALSYVGLTATYLEIRRVKEGVDFDKVANIFN